ncbi:MAG: CPBP family intramembrane metalloprotease [Bacteroidales bacterium]|jgi:membrane protease YdiL (CAAX protease family)|nr:CPBP family intramembrane metalloprotease [Bacteroidales bacterium]
MAFTVFREMKPLQQLILSAFVVIVCFLLFMTVSLIVAIPIFGMETVMNVPFVTGFDDPAVINMLKYFQIVQSFGLFIVPPIILGWLFYGNFIEYLYLNKTIIASSVCIVAVLMVSASPLINFIGELNAGMDLPDWMSGVEQWMKASEEKATKLTEAFLDVKTYRGLLLNLFMIAVLPAFGEEFLFRGIIQRIFTRITRNVNWGIWISAILFSAMHMQFYGFVPRMLLGALFGYLLVWSGSLWIPVIAHFINNGIAIVAAFYINQHKLSPYIEEIGSTHNTYYLTVISFIFVTALLVFFRKQNSKQSLSRNSQLTVDSLQ